MKSLIIEDDRSNRLLMERILGAYGPVEAVESAEDALERILPLGLEPYDLVVIDLVLPGRDGFSVAQAIRETLSKSKRRQTGAAVPFVRVRARSARRRSLRGGGRDRARSRRCERAQRRPRGWGRSRKERSVSGSLPAGTTPQAGMRRRGTQPTSRAASMSTALK